MMAGIAYYCYFDPCKLVLLIFEPVWLAAATSRHSHAAAVLGRAARAMLLS
jgi:hypothetical protein